MQKSRLSNLENLVQLYVFNKNFEIVTKTERLVMNYVSSINNKKLRHPKIILWFKCCRGGRGSNFAGGVNVT